MRRVGFLIAMIAGISGQAAAFASGPDWQWNDPGAAGFYGGAINLSDGGSVGGFSRYDAGLTPNIANDTVSTPPLLLMAGGLDVDFSIARSGVAITKKVCTAPAALQVFATAVTVCDSGVANNLQGTHIDAVDGGASFTPRLWVYVSGTGWKQVINNACGSLEVKQICK